MKINQDFIMAVETILFLKKRKKDDYLQASEIAKSLDFSVGYLQKVIQMLSRQGIVECKRGRIGGNVVFEHGSHAKRHFFGPGTTGYYGESPRFSPRSRVGPV